MFCGKCGNVLNENGICSVCDSDKAIEKEPIIPKGKYDGGENLGVKPLVSAAWFSPVAFLAPSFIAEAIVGIFNVISGLFSDDYTAQTIVSAILVCISGLLTIALAVGGAYFLYKMAFKDVDPILKKKSELIFFLPFAGYWIRSALARVLISPVTSVLYMIFTESGEYTAAGIVSSAISGVVDLIICVAVAAGLLLLSKKILAKIEENN